MSRAKISDVLPREEFVSLREQGLSYAKIAQRIGYNEQYVAEYGREVLPEELRRLKKYTCEEPDVDRCTRCGLLSEPRNPVEDGLCLWCRLEARGELYTWAESGRAVEVLGMEAVR